jgi:hypothetical protein
MVLRGWLSDGPRWLGDGSRWLNGGMGIARWWSSGGSMMV